MDATPERPASRLARVAADRRVQLALLVVAVALAVAVGVAVGRRVARPAPAGPAAPDLRQAHAIWDSWRSAATGDVDAHLACFAGEARRGLDAEVAREGRERLRSRIEADAQAALGIELRPPTPESGGRLRFPVIVQHADGAERRDYVVSRSGSDWKICAVERRGPCAVDPPYGKRLGPPSEQGE